FRLARLTFFWLVRRKIFFVDVNDLYFGAKLPITAKQNIVTRLLPLVSQVIGQLNHRARRQQVHLLVDRDQVVIDQAFRSRDGKVRRNLGRDTLEPQHTIRFAVDPDAPAVTDGGLEWG